MAEFYEQIRLVHITAALMSGGLFLLRGAALFLGVRGALSAPVRYLSWTIDTVLLAAAVMLIAIVRQYPFLHGWLTVKLLLLVVYIGLGMLAFWKGRSLPARFAAWLGALAVFGFIYSVARAHDPLGVLAPLFA